MILESIRFKERRLEILDQLKLPSEIVYVPIVSVKDGWQAIYEMKVRGAPAIAICGVLSVTVELNKKEFKDIDEVIKFTYDSLDYLITSRPTAVNMADAALKLKKFCVQLKNETDNVADFKEKLIVSMENMLDEDVATNKSIGKHGAEHILKRNDSSKAIILTHCNTGSLATAGYGTALGVVRRLREIDALEHCYCTETRPYNQGSRLTAFELVYEEIPATLICDNMVGLLLASKKVSAIVVGADRVVSNGDTANKIGTYQLAILAKYHNVPFYVAVPSTTLDFTKKTGKEIVIEERPPAEMLYVKNMRIAAEGINCWNPAFDVTPAELITGGLITEFGVFTPHELESKLKNLI